MYRTIAECTCGATTGLAERILHSSYCDDSAKEIARWFMAQKHEGNSISQTWSCSVFLFVAVRLLA